AFQPSLSPDGKQLAFIEYHATGYELHLMEMDQNHDQWTEVEIEYVEPQIIAIQQSIAWPIQQQQSNDLNISYKNKYPIHPYHPLTSFWPPTYWIPAAQLTENDLGIGFSTELKDILGFHSLPLSITYGILNNNLNYNLNYYNYSYPPIINFHLSGNTVLDSQTPTSWWEEGKTGINIYFPFKGQTASTTNYRPYRQIFSFGYQYEKSSTTNTSSPSDTDLQKITSLKLGYSYSDAEKYGFSISPELGNSFSLSYEHADKALGGDYTFDKLIFDGRKFIPLPSLHQVLALRLVAGFSSSNLIDLDLDGEKFKLGGNYSADNLTNTDVNTFSLRGYKPATLEGNNLLLTSLEYRFPLANIEHGLKLDPFSIFLERLSGTFFIDIGNAWESAGKSINITNEEDEIHSIWQNFKSSIGVELKADFNYKYDSPFTLRLGAAKALSDPKGYDIYITLGSSF
ncbi:MAG: BamA/TamA family outer membrane protein, partial [Proteobacteria bacterium]|nr:BamA/TamA family outer membrane protein [Pseudomonadota bacterium]